MLLYIKVLFPKKNHFYNQSYQCTFVPIGIYHPATHDIFSKI